MKKTKTLFLLSLLSVVFLFIACSKEKSNNKNVNDTPNTSNQEDASIEENGTGESNDSIGDDSDNENDSPTEDKNNADTKDTNDSSNTIEKAKIIYTKMTNWIPEGSDFSPYLEQHFDEHGRTVKIFQIPVNDTFDAYYSLIEFNYSEDCVEYISYSYSSDGTYTPIGTQYYEKKNYDNGYYEVNNILYNSENQIVVDATRAGSNFQNQKKRL